MWYEMAEMGGRAVCLLEFLLAALTFALMQIHPMNQQQVRCEPTEPGQQHQVHCLFRMRAAKIPENVDRLQLHSVTWST